MIKNCTNSCLVLLMALLTGACVPTLHLKKLRYDAQNELYRYSGKAFDSPLRFSTMQLVDQSHLDSFLILASTHGFRYNFQLCDEDDRMIARTDTNLVRVYASVVAALQAGNNVVAREGIDVLVDMYPSSVYFTDIYYLKASMLDNLHATDSAMHYYQKFLTYGGSKYSRLFRGHNGKAADNRYTLERVRAKERLKGNVAPSFIGSDEQLEPKYYFQSFSKGFSANYDDGVLHQKHHAGFSYITSPKHPFAAGLSLLSLPGERMALYSETIFANDLNFTSFASTYQLYLANDSRCGLKVSTILHMAYVYGTAAFKVYPGVSVSGGYQLTHQFRLGVSFTAYPIRQNRSLFADVRFYQGTDVAIFYQIVKGMSLKAGFEGLSPAVGVSVNGSFFGYSTRNRRFTLRSDFF